MLFGGYKPAMLEKWRTKPPAAAKLAKFWQKMSEDERAEAAACGWAQHWPEGWLDNISDPAAYEMLAAFWPYAAPGARKPLLALAVRRLAGNTRQHALLLRLLGELHDEDTPGLLLAAALSDPDKYEVNEAAVLLAPWREACGAVLAGRFAAMPEAARHWAVCFAGELKSGGTARVLSAALTDEAEAIRVLAAKTVQTSQLCEGEELLAFIAPALADTSPNVRMAACETLGLSGGTAAIPELRRILAADAAWQVKAMCSSFIDRWEKRLAEDILRDEGELYLKDGDKQ